MVQTEDGASHIDVWRTGLLTTLQEVLDWLVVEIPQDDSIRTVILDSLDWLERLIHHEVCKEKGVDDICVIDYGKGYGFAEPKWRAVISALDSLRASGRHIVCVAHAEVRPANNPELPEYDQFKPKLHKRACERWQEWADEVLFANFRVVIKRDGDRAIGVSCGDRVLYTTARGGCVAKNRINGIPEELPLDDFELYKTYIKKACTNG